MPGCGLGGNCWESFGRYVDCEKFVSGAKASLMTRIEISPFDVASALGVVSLKNASSRPPSPVCEGHRKNGADLSAAPPSVDSGCSVVWHFASHVGSGVSHCSVDSIVPLPHTAGGTLRIMTILRGSASWLMTALVHPSATSAFAAEPAWAWKSRSFVLLVILSSPQNFPPAGQGPPAIVVPRSAWKNGLAAWVSLPVFGSQSRPAAAS